VILSGILGALAALSLILTLWQWLAARRFPLHQRCVDSRAPDCKSAPGPGVTLLKPLKGCDAHTEACLRSWLAQDYAGEIQVLFAVADSEDPACAIVDKLIGEFPRHDAQRVLCPRHGGANAKVSKLAQIEPLAKHEIIIVSDADMRAPGDLLTNVVAMLAAPCDERPDGDMPVHEVKAAQEIGLVNCFYRLANPGTPALRWEAVAINADFWSQVLQSRSLKPLDFALGAVMATRRRHLAGIGGFRALADCLADDYQLGHRLARRGHRIELCPVVVDCWSEPMTWRDVWRHQLRWARTIRVCQPVPYFFSLLSNATLWPLLWLVMDPTPRVLAALGLCLLVRLTAAADLQQRLTQTAEGWKWLWLVPVKDLLHVALWVGAFAGHHIEWRGERYRLRRDGTLERRQDVIS
jgi:ceramide glucosyltransferase